MTFRTPKKSIERKKLFFTVHYTEKKFLNSMHNNGDEITNFF